jgi:hypothetical protein
MGSTEIKSGSYKLQLVGTGMKTRKKVEGKVKWEI